MFLHSSNSISRNKIVQNGASSPLEHLESSNNMLNSNNITNSNPALSLSSVENVSIRLEHCNFCKVSFGPSSETVIRCSDCKLVAYCGMEHKNIDWKRHKFVCNQRRRNFEDTQSLSLDSICDARGKNLCAIPSTSSSINDFRVIETNDPEVQIIEANNSPTMDSPPKTRKRALDTNGRAFKDHSKNLLFKMTFQEHIKSLANRGMVVNQHQATAMRLKYIAEHVIRSLNEYGWAVVDNFLGRKHCNRTYMEVERLYDKGMFSAGQLMDGGKNDSNPIEIRSDKIFWFGNDNKDDLVRSSVTIRLLIAMIDSVVVHFKNRIPPFDIAGRSKAMIAVYPGNGTRYVKHVDNPVRDGRCITTIYYCNEDWKLAEHGGTLRLYPETSEVPMDVDPQADRLIFFWSDKRIPHEVLPVFRHRYAITLWYFDVQERKKALTEKRKTADDDENSPTTSNGIAVENGGGSTTISFAVPTGTAPGRLHHATAQRPAIMIPTPPPSSAIVAKMGEELRRKSISDTNNISPNGIASSTEILSDQNGETPYESLQNSEELSHIRKNLECSSSTTNDVINNISEDQQPLDLSKKSASQTSANADPTEVIDLRNAYRERRDNIGSHNENINTEKTNDKEEEIIGIVRHIASQRSRQNLNFEI